jgi:hypothetical protein
MASWPSSLPAQFEVGATLEQQSPFVRSPMDTGPTKQRRRFTATSRFYNGTMLLTKDQRDDLVEFFDTTTNGGADAFDFEDPEDFGTVSARFLAPPSYTGLVGGSGGVALWRASLSVELLP